MIKNRLGSLAYQLVALVLAFGVVSLILISVDASPAEAYKNMYKGSFGEMRKFAEVLVAFVPLLLVTAGLLVTFSSGLVEHRRGGTGGAGRDRHDLGLPPPS